MKTNNGLRELSLDKINMVIGAGAVGELGKTVEEGAAKAKGYLEPRTEQATGYAKSVFGALSGGN